MLTATAALTAAVTAVLNLLVLLGWVDLSVDQIAGINVAIVAVGAFIHTILNPAVPVGVTDNT